MSVIEYKCGNCGSGMAFDSETGMLSCQSCGRLDNIEEYTEHEYNTFTEDEVQEYHCSSCGAVIMTEAETVATHCSFCGSNVVLGDRLAGKQAPAMVIPFSISKAEAIKAFRSWCKNGRLTPQGFMTADRIKSITGIYVPFWLYDLHNDIEVRAQCTKVRSYMRGEYRYTETSHFNVYRRINVDYTKVPVDASQKMNDELMDKLEPFHYDHLKDFKTPYLAGYLAEKYNYDAGELYQRVKSKINGYIESYIKSTMPGYSTIHYTSKQVDTKNKRANYVLLPVWMVQYDYHRLEHMFAMNGQTGKVVGKPPLSMAKVGIWFAGIAGASLVSMKLVAWMMGGGFW